MITILDKVIYGLGALTFVGVSLLIIASILFFLAAITMGIVDKLKGKQRKAFGGSNERTDRNNQDKQEPSKM